MILMNDFQVEFNYHKKAVEAAVSRVLASGWYILGKEVENFEKSFAVYTGAKYAIGVASGLDALQISLMALGIGPGDEVITVPNSAVATALAITNTGAKAVFSDIDEYYHLDVSKLESLITGKTRAIIPVHLFGQSVQIDEIVKIADKHGIAVVEDACQSHGAKLNGKQTGTFGITGCFSFYPTKNLGAYGDAGAIVTDSVEIYEKCKMLRNYGQKVRYYHEVKGINSRLDEIQAAILASKLPTLDLLIEKRHKIAEFYLKELAGVKNIILPKEREGGYHSFHLFAIRAERRDELQKYLKEKGIETHIHYPVPIHKQKCYPEYNSLSLVVSERVASELLSLPIHPFISENDQLTVCNAIKRFYENG